MLKNKNEQRSALLILCGRLIAYSLKAIDIINRLTVLN